MSDDGLRREPCPDCGDGIAISAAHRARGRARCPRCALDVQLQHSDVGEGPARVSRYLTVTSPALAPSHRLRVERDHRHLAISFAPSTDVAAAGIALAGGLALVVAGFAGAVPLVVAAVGFLAVLASGFVLAARERSPFHAVVERGVLRINGQPRALDDLANTPLTESEQRWLRAVVTARIAGDRDATALSTPSGAA